jgi:GNAT superfamily N-acetyltransferase
MTDLPGSIASIRRAGLDDVAALARLRWVWRTTERQEFGLSQPDFEAALLEWWMTRDGGHSAYIAEVDRTAVGMAWLAVFGRVPQPRQLERLAGNVQSVFVLAAFRNRGVGQALVEAAIADARARGLGYLIVHPSERAFPLYRRLGFAESGQMLHLDLDRSRTSDLEETAGPG